MRQKDLADRVGLDPGRLSRFISGTRKNMGIEEVARLATALDVTLSWLYEDAGPRGRAPEREPELATFEWPSGTSEAVRIAVQQQVLKEREAHRRALVPYWHGRMKDALEALSGGE